MRTLSSEETQSALPLHKLDQPTGVGFAFVGAAPGQLYDWHTHRYHQPIYASGRGRAARDSIRPLYTPARARGMDTCRYAAPDSCHQRPGCIDFLLPERCEG